MQKYVILFKIANFTEHWLLDICENRCQKVSKSRGIAFLFYIPKKFQKGITCTSPTVSFVS